MVVVFSAWRLGTRKDKIESETSLVASRGFDGKGGMAVDDQ